MKGGLESVGSWWAYCRVCDVACVGAVAYRGEVVYECESCGRLDENQVTYRLLDPPPVGRV